MKAPRSQTTTARYRGRSLQNLPVQYLHDCGDEIGQSSHSCMSDTSAENCTKYALYRLGTIHVSVAIHDVVYGRRVILMSFLLSLYYIVHRCLIIYVEFSTIVMDRARNAVLLHAEDPAAKELPLSGV